ncbi:MAG: pyridoxal phosphate-dependent decarboxylase family protein [Bryobacteraceae bacterium]
MNHAMTPEEFRRGAQEHADWIASYFSQVREHPVAPAAEPGSVRAALAPAAPEDGEPVEAIFADFQAKIFPALTLWNHPRFFGYFPSSSPPPAVLAEFLAAAVNVNGMVWKSSPAATELEQTVLGWLRQWLALPESFFGIIYDTASTGVLHALAAARQRVAPECRTEGMRADLTVYTSEQAHSSVEKAAITLGFGQHNVRKIPVDAEFRMRSDLLDRAIEADLAKGKRPCAVVATVGTTSLTAIDPLREIAAIANRHGVWLHVDAAYGGSAAILPEMRHILDGIEQAHSLVLNPHKWLYVPSDCSVLYTREPEALRAAFSLIPEYLRTAEDDRVVNLMDYGFQLGRRFRSLKLWYVLRSFGRRGIMELLREAMRLAQIIKQLVEAEPEFELCAPVTLSLVCFRHRGGDAFNEQLLAEINGTGKAFLSHTIIGGKYMLRFAVGNFQTTEQDVRETWDLIRKNARRLARSEAATALQG